MEENKQSYIFGFIAILLWSTVATAFKITLRYLDVPSMLFFSSLFSFFILGIILLFNKKIKEIKSLSLPKHISLIILGIINPAVYYYTLFKAYSLLPAQEAQAINYTWAVTFSLLAIPILKQKITLIEFGAILISYFGVVIIATHGNITSLEFSSFKGVSFALFSTLLWSSFWLANIKLKIDSVLMLFISFFWGTLFCGIFILSFSKIVIPSINGIAGAFYIGMFEMGLTFFLWTNALKKSTNPSSIATLIFLSPIISLFFINKIAGELISPVVILGLVFILFGFLVKSYFKGKNV